MDIQEFSAVIKIPANVRYEYFIKKIVDYEEVWALLCDDGYAMANDADGNLAYPFWPRKEFAQYCAIDDWEGCSAVSINLYDFIDKWIPGIKDENLKISIFPNNDDASLVAPDVLLDDIGQELEKY
jgi:hypothetical protein